MILENYLIRTSCTGCERNFLVCKWPDVSANTNCRQSNASSRQTCKFSPGPIENEPCELSDLEFSPTSESSHRKCKSRVQAESKTRKSRAAEDAEIAQSDNKVVSWNVLTKSFMGSGRAMLMRSDSPLLLQHYFEKTSSFLAVSPHSNSPFVNIILPLAYSDDLLMHAVLALSGTHLSFQRSGDYQIQVVTHQHYTSLLRNLRELFLDDFLHNDIEKILRLLLVLIILCHVEVMCFICAIPTWISYWFPNRHLQVNHMVVSSLISKQVAN